MIPDDPDAKVQHVRALGAARAKRYRARARNVRHGIVTDDNGNGNSSLTRIARHLAEGMTPNAALIAAGSSRKATGLIDKARAGLVDMLKAQGLTVAKVAESTRESIEAVTPVWNPAGNESINRPDWNARAQGRRDAIALLDRAGELPSPQGESRGSVTLNVAIITANLSRVGADHKDKSQAIDVSPLKHTIPAED